MKRYTTTMFMAAGFALLAARPVHGQMKTVAIDDAQFGIPAFRITVPAGWKVEGAVLRGDVCGAWDPKFVYRVTSPDGLSTVQKLPRQDTFWSNDQQWRQAFQSQQCPMLQPVPAEEVLKRIVLPNARPGVQPGAFEPIPLANERWARQIRENNAIMAKAAAQFRQEAPVTSGETARTRLQYEAGGRQFEEWMLVSRRTTDSPAINPRGGAPFRRYTSQAFIYASRAPLGQLSSVDEARARIQDSEVADPEWTRRQAEVLKKKNDQITHDGKAAIAKMQGDFAKWSAASHADAMEQIKNTGRRAAKAAKDSQDVRSKGSEAYRDYAVSPPRASRMTAP